VGLEPEPNGGECRAQEIEWSRDVSTPLFVSYGSQKQHPGCSGFSDSAMVWQLALVTSHAVGYMRFDCLYALLHTSVSRDSYS
jgi:hypothetical protein